MTGRSNFYDLKVSFDLNQQTLNRLDDVGSWLIAATDVGNFKCSLITYVSN